MPPCSLNTLGKDINIGEAYKRLKELNISEFRYSLDQDNIKSEIGLLSGNNKFLYKSD